MRLPLDKHCPGFPLKGNHDSSPIGKAPGRLRPQHPLNYNVSSQPNGLFASTLILSNLPAALADRVISLKAQI